MTSKILGSFVLAIVGGLAAVGCASLPQHSPDIFYPESFWDREREGGYEDQMYRFAENWQVALEYPAVRKSLRLGA
jgi:hypothetical protein